MLSGSTVMPVPSVATYGKRQWSKLLHRGIWFSLYEKILLNADSVYNIEPYKAEYASEKVNKDFSGLIAYLR
jgi:hypothetical protein